MKCPRCSAELVRTQYEGVNLRVCSHCNGHLVRAQKLESIRRRGERSIDDLFDEATASTIDWPTESIRCPKCHRRMIKQEKNGITLDYCSDCDCFWLDPAELAAYQFVYETSEAGKDARERQRKLAEMSDEEKARLTELISKCKEPRYLDWVDFATMSWYYGY